jgi:hypothetical protein
MRGVAVELEKKGDGRRRGCGFILYGLITNGSSQKPAVMSHYIQQLWNWR